MQAESLLHIDTLRERAREANWRHDSAGDWCPWHSPHQEALARHPEASTGTPSDASQRLLGEGTDGPRLCGLAQTLGLVESRLIWRANPRLASAGAGPRRQLGAGEVTDRPALGG